MDWQADWMMFKGLKKNMVRVGFIVLVTSYLAVLYVFFGAFFSKEKYITLYVDLFGEGILEAVGLLASLPCVVYTVQVLHRNFKKISEMEMVDEQKASEKID